VTPTEYSTTVPKAFAESPRLVLDCR
jgi:hypothetical protein